MTASRDAPAYASAAIGVAVAVSLIRWFPVIPPPAAVRAAVSVSVAQMPEAPAAPAMPTEERNVHPPLIERSIPSLSRDFSAGLDVSSSRSSSREEIPTRPAPASPRREAPPPARREPAITRSGPAPAPEPRRDRDPSRSKPKPSPVPAGRASSAVDSPARAVDTTPPPYSRPTMQMAMPAPILLVAPVRQADIRARVADKDKFIEWIRALAARESAVVVVEGSSIRVTVAPSADSGRSRDDRRSALKKSIESAILEFLAETGADMKIDID